MLISRRKSGETGVDWRGQTTNSLMCTQRLISEEIKPRHIRIIKSPNKVGSKWSLRGNLLAYVRSDRGRPCVYEEREILSRPKEESARMRGC